MTFIVHILTLFCHYCQVKVSSGTNKNLPMWSKPVQNKRPHLAKIQDDPGRCSWAGQGHTDLFQDTSGTCVAPLFAGI